MDTILAYLSAGGLEIAAFLIVLSVVVFVHELGHYAAARACGVRVEVFSIGFGRELFGWNDKHGTRWQFSLVPLGGYVRMLGDEDMTSASVDQQKVAALSETERCEAFPLQPLRNRAFVVAAGPLANFVFAVVALSGLYMAYGETVTTPQVGSVLEDSAATEAGLRIGDIIQQVDGRRVDSFNDVVTAVQLSAGQTMTMDLLRDGEIMTLSVTPRMLEREDRLGNISRQPLLGITSVEGATERISHGPVSAVVAAVDRTAEIVQSTLIAVGQIITGVRSVEDLGGPVKIAQYAGHAASIGALSLFTLMIVLSVNLGLINLFPIPVLDGGHLAFYAVEGLRGRPLSERAQDYSLRVGMVLLFGFMIFVTWNDVTQRLGL